MTSSSRNGSWLSSWWVRGGLSAAVFACVAGLPVSAQQAAAPPQQAPSQPVGRPCRANGQVTSGDDPLPGATVTAKAGDKVAAVSSTDLDGSYSLPLAPGTYTIRIDLTAFASSEQTVTLGQPPCAATSDAKLLLLSRAPADALKPPTPVAAAPAAPPATTAAVTPPAGRSTTGAPPATAAGTQASAANAQGRGGRGGANGANRFQSVTVQQSQTANGGDATTVDLNQSDLSNDPAAKLLPPGFSLDAPLESVAVNGSMVQVDRSQLADRLASIGRGDFNLADDPFAAGAAAQGLLGAGGQAGGDQGGRGGGRGGGAGGFGGGGFGGRLGGANGLQVQANYSLGGTPFDAAPYSLNGLSVAKPTSTQQSVLDDAGWPGEDPAHLRRHAAHDVQLHVQRIAQRHAVRSDGQRAG